MKRCSISLVNRKMESKTTMSYYYTHSNGSNYDARDSKDVEELELLVLVVRL